MPETPDDLDRLTAAQQAVVPSFGLGFLKVTVPESVRHSVAEHFRRVLPHGRPEARNSYLLPSMPGATPSLLLEDPAFNQGILDALHPIHEEWAGMKLRGTSCYGIRVYLRGSYLYNHVDVMQTHVISSTMCVDHELSSPWPLYIEDLDGRPHEVVMSPGEMVFYESARLRHGRPYPLDGEFYAGMFVHYAPLDWPYAEQPLP